MSIPARQTQGEPCVGLESAYVRIRSATSDGADVPNRGGRTANGSARGRSRGPNRGSRERNLSDGGSRERPFSRAAFAQFVGMTTRWRDNDIYGHLNNVAYYEFFDAAVNGILIEAGLLDPRSSPIIGFVADSDCRFFSSLSYPDRIEIGVTVEHLGRASVRYLLAAFKAGASLASAQGRYTHVYVERASGKPTPIPEGHRRLMESLRVAGSPSATNPTDRNEMKS